MERNGSKQTLVWDGSQSSDSNDHETIWPSFVERIFFHSMLVPCSEFHGTRVNAAGGKKTLSDRTSCIVKLHMKIEEITFDQQE